MVKATTRTKSAPATNGADLVLLDSLVGYNLRRAAARQRERFRHTFGPYDIRPVQLTVLTLILHNSHLRQSTLGDLLGIKRANVVKLLDELQDRGLTERKPCSEDRRAYEIHLTAAGERLAKELLRLHQKLEADLARDIGPEELNQLVRLLKKFRQVDAAPTLR